ncbi:hypothetical protein GCM10009547_33300 [Sporichthya brevicatena]|uniref:MFS transporter n=2 Tax=Sporichthya brevicatena TaxID=171442 RepID=A0ABN1H2D4_9ACTN
MPFVPSLGVLAGLIVLAGVPISPTLISGMGLVRSLAPPARLTEGFAWATTGLSVGLMTGSAAAGWLAEHVGPADAFWAATVAALSAATLAAAGAPRLRRGPGVHPIGVVPGTVP